MPHLRHPDTKPSCGWVYLQPDTQLWIEAESKKDLEIKVGEHREYKGLPIGDIAKDVEDQLCMILGIEWCMANPGETWTPYKDISDRIGLTQVMDFSSFMLEKIKSGEPLVPKEIASQRASICKKCPFNRPLRVCACTPFYKLLNSLIPLDLKDPGLHICGICGCSLQVKTLMPQSVIDKDNLNKQRKYPHNCWQ